MLSVRAVERTGLVSPPQSRQAPYAYDNDQQCIGYTKENDDNTTLSTSKTQRKFRFSERGFSLSWGLG